MTHKEKSSKTGENPEGANGPNPKGEKKQSMVWLHFVKMDSGLKAVCKHCSTQITCRTEGGSTTSAMLNHLKRCKLYLNLGVSEEDVDENEAKRVKQSTLFHCKGAAKDKEVVPSYLTFNKEDSRRALVRMIIKDELPFRFVEREGFQEFMRVVQPRFIIPSRRTVTRECLALFEEEREQLRKWFKKFSGSVSLTTDTWSSCQNLTYMCLTAHFIDSEWRLHKKIINFCQISSHSGEMIGKTIEKCLLFWGIDKVFTITVDNTSSNDLGVRYMRRSLGSRGGCVLDGEFLHMRCGAHILGLIVKDGLKDVEAAIYRIRLAVRYVKSSPSRLSKFKECLEQLKLPTNCGICLDVETRWNSTYLMLESAIKVRKAFDLLELKDRVYRQEMASLPSHVDWSYAEGLVPFLQSFYETTVKISGSLYITSNVYMKEIFGLSLLIMKMGMDGTNSIREMSSKMREKYDKYWGNFDNMNMIIFVATTLDPRYKRQWVKWLIDEIYSKEDAAYLLSKIDDALEKMFKHYKTIVPENVVSSSKRDDNVSEVNVQTIGKIGSWMTSMYKKHKESKGHAPPESELERYLVDECENDEDDGFDILCWWKTTGSKYKVLSLMARDVLAVPVSTVASESAFSAGGRVLDSFRSSLSPRMVEALICTQDWIRRQNQPLLVEESMDDILELEAELELENITSGHMDVDDY
ncbi:hypothetical protein Bca4012_039192 [Brassica carinata]